ncbi:ketoacyl-ACP synthase III [Metabacillus bambusae]|uniref:Ketoacyl-ACP synthase III n=1 Tax=Metabacillus bambusae TaxID=2795218 RepID=A0ABS3N0K5_9BACI|nr:ketoacyl-ACP synthase III [Metabacillus bambusae]MBO1511738.1 ketoacyl-ACP synthase III [Metabacillus bambusae]
MIGIREIASYLPNKYLSNFERVNEFQINDDFIENKLGIEKVLQKELDEDTSDMCIKAYHNLQEKINVNLDEIDCIIVCTQNPDGNGIPHTSAIVHGKLGASTRCASFDISLGCSGYVYGISIIKSFMESNGLRNGLLFTCDPYSKVINPSDKNTALLFGDIATVTLLNDCDGKELWFPRKFTFGTSGADGSVLNNNNGYLEMNGRAVFNFSAKAVPNQVKELLSSIQCEPEEIDLFLFHQGSKYIVDTIKKRLNLSDEKAPINLKNQGNTVSSSIPLLLENYIKKDNYEKIILSGFGVGLSWATCIIERKNNN